MHQNAECLSFCDSSFDLLVSCDVFEHVNDYRKCICEAARVLNPDGKMLLTIPFDTENDFNLRCAEVVEGRLIYYNEPEYHGNPISHKGSLVFWRFGWELLDDICQAGFQDVYMVPYYSVELGYLGGVQSIIVAVK